MRNFDGRHATVFPGQPMNALDELLELHAGSSRQAQSNAKIETKPVVDLGVESYSGLKVKASTRTLSRDDVASLAKGFAVHRLPAVPQLLHKPAATLAATPWMTIGVLVERGPAKATQNGGKFCVWKISDMRSPATTISCFLFSEACEVAWRYLPGTTFALLNPKPVPPKEGGAAAMSIDKQPQLQRIGQVGLGARLARMVPPTVCRHPHFLHTPVIRLHSLVHRRLNSDCARVSDVMVHRVLCG